ncbi:uncharacterized protein LOC142819121 [Pelodiscus sinensis]|uniref:uncharacterized protein LOC142819121 n=1 Tax=Pelodiscus sinensis TaxID=13735 RepID=UPI003F6B5A4A
MRENVLWRDHFLAERLAYSLPWSRSYLWACDGPTLSCCSFCRLPSWSCMSWTQSSSRSSAYVREQGPCNHTPRFRRLDTSSYWWDRQVMERWDDQQWLPNLRMRKELCLWLAPALHRWDTQMRPAIPLEKWVTITIWKLATPDSYWSVCNQFGVGKSTVGALLMVVVRAINTVLLCRVIRLGDLDLIVARFAALGFPNSRGTIDGTHIHIQAPDH